MPDLRVDGDWQKITHETDNDGDLVRPQYARHVRTEGGMVVGRIIKVDDLFMAQKYKFGDFVTLDKFNLFDAAYWAIVRA